NMGLATEGIELARSSALLHRPNCVRRNRMAYSGGKELRRLREQRGGLRKRSLKPLRRRTALTCMRKDDTIQQRETMIVERPSHSQGLSRHAACLVDLAEQQEIEQKFQIARHLPCRIRDTNGLRERLISSAGRLEMPIAQPLDRRNSK